MKKVKKIVHKWSWVLLITFCVVGVFYPIIGSIALICMLAPIIVSFFRGRFWCGNFCPRGSFNDNILSRISFKKSVPKFLKTVWFRNTFLIVLMTGFTIQVAFAWGDLKAIGMVFVRMIFITTLMAIFLGVFYKPRTWCMICPMGNLSQYVSKINIFRKKSKHVVFDNKKCVSCKLCSKSCPIEIDLLEYKEQGKVTHSNCLKCNVCVEKCPKKAVHIA